MHVIQSQCVSDRQLTVTYEEEEQEVITSEEIQLEHVLSFCLKMTRNINRSSKRLLSSSTTSEPHSGSFSLETHRVSVTTVCSSGRNVHAVLILWKPDVCSVLCYLLSEWRPMCWDWLLNHVSPTETLRDQLSSVNASVPPTTESAALLMCSGADRTPGC